MRTVVIIAACIGALTVGAYTPLRASAPPYVVADSQIDAGRYVVLTAGCNHCHTLNWQTSNGSLPQSAWLKGGIAPPNVPAPNLRVIVHALPPAAFVALFRTKQPPSAMPWVDLRNLSDSDLRAVDAFIRSLK